MATKKPKEDEITEVKEPVDQLKFLKKMATALNKEFGDDNAQLFDSNEGSIDNVSDYVKTGVPAIDYILGGKGFPVGRISEIYGESSSGKTAIAMHILKQTIDRGGSAVLLDSEAAFSFDMAYKIGLDRTKLLYIKPTTLEGIWGEIDKIVELANNHAKGHLVTIVVDSIASAPAKDELENEVEKAEVGIRARVNSKALRRVTMAISNNSICLILLNQIRDNIMVQYGDKVLIPGGKAIDFHSSLKLKVGKGKAILDTTTTEKLPIGQYMRLKVTKNKLAKPFMETELEFFFDTGIPVYSGLMEKMLREGLLVKHTPHLVFKTEKFYAKDFDAFMEGHPELLDLGSWEQYKIEKEDI